MHASVLFAALTCACAQAATEEWTYGGLTGVLQVVADGAGGCAMTRFTDGPYDYSDVVWLDKNGALLYQAALSNALRAGILVCTPKHLVYSDMRETNLVMYVAQDGTATMLPAAANTFNRSPALYPLYWQSMADRKGFFAIRTDTNTQAATLVRYTNK
jgi:hypothetical protein